MRRTPKSNRLHISIFGRTNVGKSSVLNFITAQEVSIASPFKGTTTDVVEKPMELLPIGPVVFLDTAGLDDNTELGALRLKKTFKVFDRTDILILVLEPDAWTDYEEKVVRIAKNSKIPFIFLINKIDLKQPSQKFLEKLMSINKNIVCFSSVDYPNRDKYIRALKELILKLCPEDFLKPPPLIGDLLPSGGLAILVVPIDLQAPKGRLILPQVQTIRDALDNDSACLVVKEKEFPYVLNLLKKTPDIVVCDSQVVLKVCATTPLNVKCTTFSILFARYKGDLVELAKNVAFIEKLKPGDKILIAESCTHHPIEDDIGRVKIPRWLRQYVGGDLKIDVYSGRDYPENLKEYKLIIHCGACMLTRREMLSRIYKAKEENIPITNYGICISFLQGVIKRTLVAFPQALDAFERNLEDIRSELVKINYERRKEYEIGRV